MGAQGSWWLKVGLRYWPIVAVLTGLWVLHSGWTAILLYHAGIVVGLALRPRAFASLTRGWSWPLAGLSLLVAVGTWIAVWTLLPWFVGHDGLLKALGAAHLDDLWLFGVFALYFSTVHPILEELSWRELLHPKTAKPHLRDLEFAAYHVVVLQYLFPGRWLLMTVSVVSLVIAAWIWRALRERLGGLAIPAFSHALADLAIVSAAILGAFDIKTF